jgi:hypothetical protein
VYSVSSNAPHVPLSQSNVRNFAKYNPFEPHGAAVVSSGSFELAQVFACCVMTA